MGARTKGAEEFREAAQAYTDQALGVLAGVMLSSESDAARVAAANSLLDRGHGKPRQQHEVTGADGKDLIPPETDRSKMALAVLSILRDATGEPDGAKPASGASE